MHPALPSLGLLALLGAAPALEEVTRAVPDAVVDLRYATADNFMQQAAYPPDARCLLVPDAAQRLAAAAVALRQQGFRLLLWDCYRPRAVQYALWKRVPKVGLVADPKTGSHHNRGAAVDVGLVALDGGTVELPTGFDDFSRAARHFATGSTAAARAHREALRTAMEDAGFKRNYMEWWHYELPGAGRFPLRDEPFSPDAGAMPDRSRGARGEAAAGDAGR